MQFEVSDATKRELPAATYDIVYSRDTILHIEDKKALFTRFLVRTKHSVLATEVLSTEPDQCSILCTSLVFILYFMSFTVTIE